MPPTREQIVAAARTYLGVPFKLRGRDRMGIDCIGLLRAVGVDCGYDFPDFTDYGRGPEVQKLNYYVETYSDPAPRGVYKIGQVLKLRQSVFPMHLGIIATDQYGRLTVINANVRERKVIDQPIGYWESMIIAPREYLGVR